jgi:uroporphyrinogen decarboxylase
MGNVRPIEVMRQGTPEQVIIESLACLRQCHNSPRGYILSSGCQIPMNTPFENIEAMMLVARTFGRWPVDAAIL